MMDDEGRHGPWLGRPSDLGRDLDGRTLLAALEADGLARLRVTGAGGEEQECRRQCPAHGYSAGTACFIALPGSTSALSISGTSASCQKLSSIMMPSGSCRKTCCSGRAGTFLTSNGTLSFLTRSIVPRMSAQLIATWSIAPPPWSLRPLSDTRCRIAFSPA